MGRGSPRGFYCCFGIRHRLAMKSLCMCPHDFPGAPTHLPINYLNNIIYFIKKIHRPFTKPIINGKTRKYTNTPTCYCFFWMLGVILIIYYTIKLKKIKIRVKNTCHLAFKSKKIIILCKNI